MERQARPLEGSRAEEVEGEWGPHIFALVATAGHEERTPTPPTGNQRAFPGPPERDRNPRPQVQAALSAGSQVSGE